MAVKRSFSFNRIQISELISMHKIEISMHYSRRSHWFLPVNIAFHDKRWNDRT